MKILRKTRLIRVEGCILDMKKQSRDSPKVNYKVQVIIHLNFFTLPTSTLTILRPVVLWTYIIIHFQQYSTDTSGLMMIFLFSR